MIYIQNVADRLVHLLSLKDFVDALSARINCVYEKEKRVQIETNFKSIAKKRGARVNLTLVIRKWLDLFVFRRSNNFLCAGDQVNQVELEQYMTISTMLVSCMGMFIIGLGQIWFFSEYASLRRNNSSNNESELNEINKT